MKPEVDYLKDSRNKEILEQVIIRKAFFFLKNIINSFIQCIYNTLDDS